MSGEPMCDHRIPELVHCSECQRLADAGSLRDQFAMAALTGMISAAGRMSTLPDHNQNAKAAYIVADAMMEARIAKEGE